MMGVAFAEHLVAFMRSKGHAMKEVIKIARNPEQSKHLETARVTAVLGYDIDFVNLRSEVYTEGSRIPSEIVGQRIWQYSCY
jgi:tRNA nucleotidyltransferase (CCA-adding enzyme)